MEQLYE